MAVFLATLLLAVCTYGMWDYWRVSQLYVPPEERALVFREDTLRKAQETWVFRHQVGFAALTVTPVSLSNAEKTLASSKALLHFSPEPRVVEKLLDSALLLGRTEEVAFYLERFKRAFPEHHGHWIAGQQRTLQTGIIGP